MDVPSSYNIILMWPSMNVLGAMLSLLQQVMMLLPSSEWDEYWAARNDWEVTTILQLRKKCIRTHVYQASKELEEIHPPNTKPIFPKWGMALIYDLHSGRHHCSSSPRPHENDTTSLSFMIILKISSLLSFGRIKTSSHGSPLAWNTLIPLLYATN